MRAARCMQLHSDMVVVGDNCVALAVEVECEILPRREALHLMISSLLASQFMFCQPV